ncbi:MAG: 23S rRNA (pseudouridine(1915)-N(3))-methyltransferase RlmH [Paramuribaculum sp.]|nr:23S rRNA (pseudouridine(1915)-N(3))-methyltransferase RlmH [Paramuribaculum sp.]
MKIVLAAIGKTTTQYIRTGIDIYLDRVQHYIPVQTCIIPDIKTTKTITEAAQKEREGMALLQMLQPGDRLILLDERGKRMTSRQFSESIERHMISGCKRVVYAVGGPYGFSSQVYERADGKLSLSDMTFPHEMVRLFFTEQLYRAMTIMRGEPYHHD